MAKSSSQGSSRRQFLASTAVIGAASLLVSNETTAQDPPKKFAGLTPLKPAPTTSANKAAITLPPLAALVMNKAGYGPRPGDVASFNALGIDDASRLAAWLEIQLNPDGSEPEISNRFDALQLGSAADQAAFDTIDKSAEQLWADHVLNESYLLRNRPVWQMERLTLLRGMYSPWQLQEVMYDFWFNHFNVFGREYPTYGMMPEYDRQLRLHMFGNFGDMLKAVSKTASMLYYLDNYNNNWPYPNENYAREVLELHTLGAVENYYGAVDPNTLGTIGPDNQRAGYTEIDVFQFARALTGWGVSGEADIPPNTGDFLFRPERHYNFSQGDIEVMDVTIAGPGGGQSDVEQILDYLAGHYGTAQYIAWKLCTRLIGDTPPDSIVQSTANEFYSRSGDADQLREVYRHVLESNEFLSTWGEKIRRPVETIIRAMRAVDLDLTFRIDDSISNNIFYQLDDTGQYPFAYEAPTGFPDERELWQGSGPLITSWRTVTYMLRQNTSALNLALQTNDGIPLLADRSPSAIVDFWMNRALGYSLDSGSRSLIIQFIIDNLPGDPELVINADTTNVSEGSYQKILRAVVGLILMSPEAMRR